jgi:hypothetical protein
MVEAIEKNYGTEVIFNGMTSLLNFMKIYQLLGGHTDGLSDRERRVMS